MAAIVFHGKGRNVEGYFRALQGAAADGGPDARGAILLAPQFLREEDAEAHRISKRYLRWHAGAWVAGEPAVGPLPISTFDVIDALLITLSNRKQFPNLKTIVLVGHSGGGQLLNRYAIVGRQPSVLVTAGTHVRFVIANPSSYFYFSDERPQPDGSFSRFSNAECSKFNHWRYGPLLAPAYVGDVSSAAWERREADYVSEDVIYLLGGEDTDPGQVDLDTSCAGEAEGPDRLFRGKAYFRYLTSRHPSGLRHRLSIVPGVGHLGNRMIDSPCGVAAVFKGEECAPQRLDQVD